jgi:adenosylhomocysteine nucleosidase
MSGRHSFGDEGASATPVLAPLPADIGIVAALSIEVGYLVDRLAKVRKYSGPRHSIVEGECAGKIVALIVTGVGREPAARGTRTLLDGHRPRWVLSAGFGGALNPDLARFDLVMPSEVVDLKGHVYPVDEGVPVAERNPRIKAGRLLTVDGIVRTAAEKAELRARFGADVVDMESAGVAAACAERSARFLSIRVISDEAEADLPPEVATMITGSGSYRVGAALRAIWNRPSSLKDFWALHEHAREAADRLATMTVSLIERLD